MITYYRRQDKPTEQKGRNKAMTMKEWNKILEEEIERIKSGKKASYKTVEDYEKKFIYGRPVTREFKAVIMHDRGASTPETNSYKMMIEEIAKAVVKGEHGRMYRATETGYKLVWEF